MRERIIEVSKRLFYEQGYGNTTLRQISRECGIAHPSIFYHFATKGQILADILGEFSELWQERIAARFPEIDYLQMEILTTVLNIRYAYQDERYGRLFHEACRTDAVGALVTGWAAEYYADLVSFDTSATEGALDRVVFGVMMEAFARIWEARESGALPISYDEAVDLTLEIFRRILAVDSDAFGAAKSVALKMAAEIDYRDIPFF